MNNFDYAQPDNLDELLDLLSAESDKTELLAGGTDLIGLMKQMIVTPQFVVNVNDVAEMQGIDTDGAGDLVIGAAVRLDEIRDCPLTEPFDALRQAIDGTANIQFPSQSTLGGELCRRPRCWYFRDGHGLLAENGRMVVDGDNRFHAILGNGGPAKFVNASRLAPPLVALGAEVRIAGPKTTDQRQISLEELYQTPRREGQRENVLKRNQVVTAVVIPSSPTVISATYEVHHGQGQDDPLAAAAVAVSLRGGLVERAKIVLGQVAPIPWVSSEATQDIVGQPINESTAEAAGLAAVSAALPLSQNEYKVQLAKVAVKRALLQATTAPTGGVYA
ncbi:MAG: FAD binding domain-containing protein [Pirellulales bacterium]